MGFELHHGDCLDVMATLSDASIDCVLTDPPYGTTACKWDSVIPFEPMWKELKRIAKPKAAICLFGSQPFTSALVMSNPKMFKYEWIWEKSRPSGFVHCNRTPLKEHEQIAVFGGEHPQYFPQMRAVERVIENPRTVKAHSAVCQSDRVRAFDNGGQAYPRTVMNFANPNHNNVHPTQKPVELLRYLIRTYTLANETVLDFTMGSGSTGVACELENRSFIGIEKDAEYFKIATNRIEGVKKKEPLFAAA